MVKLNDQSITNSLFQKSKIGEFILTLFSLSQRNRRNSGRGKRDNAPDLESIGRVPWGQRQLTKISEESCDNDLSINRLQNYS